ncbi:C-glycoside deglycosidase beta subunit domain-containing protein [Neobacillus vireti]|uniref:C-glycoside deglycosidase beta subunit domain-containing protein n=1 Tax=Neobacillus vireti TaxID=220686 RepID=UPI003000E3B3
MFDNFLIRNDSLENVYKDDRVIGFKFAVRIADYRGCFLSLHNGYYIECDGVEYPKDLQKFEINDKEPRDFEEIKKCVWEHWNYDDEGYVYVKKEGGLTPGMHTIKLQQSVLAAYGYMPWDEEWLNNPPVPGKGAGSGKTANICSFDLELQERR